MELQQQQQQQQQQPQQRRQQQQDPLPRTSSTAINCLMYELLACAQLPGGEHFLPHVERRHCSSAAKPCNTKTAPLACQ
jgi:hypothetical protein